MQGRWHAFRQCRRFGLLEGKRAPTSQVVDAWQTATVNTVGQWLRRFRIGGRIGALGSLSLVLAGVLAGCAAHRTYGDVDVTTGPVNLALGRTELQRRSSAGVAIIETDVGRGMGFVIDAQGYLITNRHVIEDGDHIESVVFPATNPPRRYQSVEVVYIDPKRDLALLSVNTSDTLPLVPLASRRAEPTRRYLDQRDPVLLFERREDERARGFDARNGSVSNLSVYNPAAGPGPFVGVTTNVEEGQSGGPVLDRYGRAVGIVTWAWRDRGGGFAIPIADAHRMLSERPRLDDDERRTRRAEDRSQAFLAALGRGDVEGARVLTSPSHAREIREQTTTRIFDAVEHGGLPGMQGFIAALESVIDKAQPDPSGEQVAVALGEIIERTGGKPFREALGLDDSVPTGQIVSFFYEFGHAYVAARLFGRLDRSEALDAAFVRLHTVDAARTFALARALSQLAGSSIEIDQVEVIPGAYAPRAVVSLRITPATRGAPSVGVQTELAPRRLTLHLKMEWGDWYIAELSRTPLSGESPQLAPASDEPSLLERSLETFAG